MRLFLDIDGLIANLIKSTCKRLDIKYPKNQILEYGWILPRLEESGRNISHAYKIWSKEEIWENCELYPWSKKIVSLVYKYDKKFRFLTKPTMSPECYSGKAKWIKKHFGRHLNKLIICNGSKAILCRGLGDLLIDDCPKNIKEWQDAGGSTFYWKEVTDDFDVSLRLIELEDKLKELSQEKRIELEEITFD
jgi:5'(3')-deoxyribonucleotidase